MNVREGEPEHRGDLELQLLVRGGQQIRRRRGLCQTDRRDPDTGLDAFRGRAAARNEVTARLPAVTIPPATLTAIT